MGLKALVDKVAQARGKRREEGEVVRESLDLFREKGSEAFLKGG